VSPANIVGTCRAGHVGPQGGGVVVAADPAQPSRSVLPSIVRTGPDPVLKPARPSAARRRVARVIATSSSGRPRPLSAAASSEFGVHVDLVTGRLTMTGRLDVRSTHLLYDAVSALLTAQHPSWTVDVGRLTDIDHAGLRGLLGTYHRGLRHGRRITLRGASSSLQQVLTVLRLDRHLSYGAGTPIPAEPESG
jgi:anti-anti-sigma factor